MSPVSQLVLGLATYTLFVMGPFAVVPMVKRILAATPQCLMLAAGFVWDALRLEVTSAEVLTRLGIARFVPGGILGVTFLLGLGADCQWDANMWPGGTTVDARVFWRLVAPLSGFTALLMVQGVRERLLTIPGLRFEVNREGQDGHDVVWILNVYNDGKQTVRGCRA
ncbi:MAG: hypothetical protein HQ548_03125, partial [Chloroflexi bacterium]|nr:hypothetical protein [Chloroflexota bacterium]